MTDYTEGHTTHGVPSGEWTVAVDLSEDRMQGLMPSLATTAVDTNESVTLIGATSSAALLCRGVCRYRHPGSIVVVPDVVMLELSLLGVDPSRVSMKRHDGRDVYLFQVPSGV